MKLFKNREDAGHQLAQKLLAYKNAKDTVIIAIPRGGLVIGAELAKVLHLPLDVFFTKKIGHPTNPEYAIGVVGLEKIHVEEEVSQTYIQEESQKIRKSLLEREQKYRKGFSPLNLKGKTVIITDDGVATGKTLLLTLQLIYASYRPKQCIVAIPVGPQQALDLFQSEADKAIFLATPPNFFAISEFYEDFGQVEDMQAIQLLQEYHGT